MQLIDRANATIDKNAYNLFWDSDIHGFGEDEYINYQIYKYFAAKNMADDMITTGDNVLDRYSDTFSYWQKNPDKLLIIGNHDALNASSGYDWTNQPSQQDMYYRFFQPYINNTNINITPNKTYWYKEYSTKKIMLIGLNVMLLTTSGRDETKTFLNNCLQLAITNNESVIIAVHWPFNQTKTIPSNWTVFNPDKGHGFVESNTDTFETSLMQLVSEYIDKGLNFICYICGHAHQDFLSISTGIKNKQLFITNTCTYIDSCNDIPRISGTTSVTTCNLLSYKDGFISITRFGGDTTVNNRPRKFLKIKTDGTIIIDD